MNQSTNKRQLNLEQALHDIKSPLSALSLLIPSLEQVEPNRKLILENALQRILKITSQVSTPQFTQDPSNSVFDLTRWLEDILDEKRVEHSPKKIEFHLFPLRSGLLKNSIYSLDSLRVLSNLLNNAAEASEDKGAVAVYMSALDNKLCIRIDDDGCGFPPEILENIGKIGNTTKQKGAGLGLFHAIQVIERDWNGNIFIDSAPGIGTAISILLDLD